MNAHPLILGLAGLAILIIIQILRGKWFVIVPDDETISTAVVAAHHTGILQGHWGEAKTTEIVRRRFWFPGMPAFIQDFIKKCDTCQRIKADRHK